MNWKSLLRDLVMALLCMVLTGVMVWGASNFILLAAYG